jgi:hypothetical protein
MSAMTLTSTNGTKPAPTTDWLQQSVQKFFTSFNWEDHPPAVQEIKLTADQGNGAALSLTLSVSQFFSTIPWEGNTIAPNHAAADSPSPLTTEDEFTLEDFSDLF